MMYNISRKFYSTAEIFMQYHIQTTPIWDAFKEECGCPMCRIYKASEQRLIKQYLGEAVMQPEYRVRVNERGFCTRHTLALYKGDNKLGTALQFATRIETVNKNIREIKKAKQAKSLALDLQENLDTCVICDTVDEMMVRYSYTVAQMFDNEQDFPSLFAVNKGFCMKHFTELLKYVSFAGKSADKYLETLINVQKKALDKAENDLNMFASKFDYRNAGRVSDRYDNAIADAIKLLKGDVL
jgi:hypothetical protein